MKLGFSTTDLLGRLFPWHSNHWVDQMAGEVAQRCRAQVWRRVCRRTSNMSMAELRGYVRAQAARWIDGEIDHLASQGPINPALRARVADTAINQLISMVAHDVLSESSPADMRNMAA
jgi:hypothetical protein